jgi:hypothetical protein
MLKTVINRERFPILGTWTNIFNFGAAGAKQSSVLRSAVIPKLIFAASFPLHFAIS